MSLPQANTDEFNQLNRAAKGDEGCWQSIIQVHRERLRHLASFRLDDRLRGRIDPSDVVQEVFLEAVSRLGDYLANPTMPFFLWLRLLTRQRLAILYRQH